MSAPHQKLETHWPEFRIAHVEMEVLVDNLYRRRRIERLSNHERHYELTKRISVRNVEKLQMVSRALWSVNQGYLESLNSRMYRIRNQIVAANLALKIFLRDTGLAAQDLHLIRMSRNGSTDTSAQNVYNILHHHVKDLRASTRSILGVVQRQRAILGIEKVPTSTPRARRVLAALQPQEVRLERRNQPALESETPVRETIRPLRQTQCSLDFSSARNSLARPQASKTILPAKRKSQPSNSKRSGRTGRCQWRSNSLKSQVKPSTAVSQLEKAVSPEAPMGSGPGKGFEGSE